MCAIDRYIRQFECWVCVSNRRCRRAALLDAGWEISGNSHKIHSRVKKEHTNTTKPATALGRIVRKFSIDCLCRRGRENCIKYVWPAQSHDDALLCRFIQSRRSSACAHALKYSHQRVPWTCARMNFLCKCPALAGRRESRIRRTHTATAATQFASKG